MLNPLQSVIFNYFAKELMAFACDVFLFLFYVYF